MNFFFLSDSPDRPEAAKRWVFTASLVLFGLTALIGALVIIGWFFKIPVLIQILPHWPPTNFNTALGLLLSGIGGAVFLTNRNSLAKACAAAVFLLGGITIVEYVVGVSFIDELFIEAHITTELYHPGRIAPNAALCFVFVSFVIALFSSDLPQKWKSPILEISVLIVFTLSLLALIGYITDLRALYGWGHMTAIALYAGFGLLFFSVGAIIYQTGLESAKILTAPVFFLIAVFIADLNLPADYPVELGYIPVLFFALWIRRTYFSIALGIVASIFILAAAYAEREWIPWEEAPLVFVILIMAYLFHHYKESQEGRLQLEEANRQKSEFLALLGHELRNPLAAIDGGIQILKISPEDKDKALGVIQNNVRLMNRLLDDLLDMTRISQGRVKLHKTTLDCREVIKSSIDMVSGKIKEKRQTLTVNMPDEPLFIYADQVRIEQIFSNVLTNARKYTQEGGCIHVEAKKENEKILVRITDNGRGIPKDQLEEIFKPFKQVGNIIGTPGSLGIGLALTWQLTRLHGGAVKAYSEGDGKGATFTIVFPATTQHEEIRNKSTGQPKTSGRHLKILLVDDNPEAIMSFPILMEKEGWTAKECYSPHDAINIAQKFRPDVFVLDIGMPEMNGYELAKYLKSHGHDKALYVALSGFGLENTHKMSKKAGIDYHINKPANFDSLKDIIESHFEDQVLPKAASL